MNIPWSIRSSYGQSLVPALSTTEGVARPPIEHGWEIGYPQGAPLQESSCNILVFGVFPCRGNPFSDPVDLGRQDH